MDEGLGGVLRVDGGKRIAGCDLSDRVAAYGAGVLGRPLTCLEEIQLQLNVERVRLRRAAEVALGVSVAQSEGDLDDTWFEAVTDTPEEAANLKFAVNAERQFTRDRQKIRERYGC